MPEEMEKKAEKEAPAPKPASQGKLLLVIVVALASSIGGSAVSWFFLGRAASPAPAAPAVEEEKKETESKDPMAEALESGGALPLDPFVVNLADVDTARYLRIKISLMVDDKESIEHISENQALQLKLRDVILQTLTQKTSKDLINEAGKNELRREIRTKIEGYFKKPKLVDVMFTEFVIQL